MIGIRDYIPPFTAPWRRTRLQWRFDRLPPLPIRPVPLDRGGPAVPGCSCTAATNRAPSRISSNRSSTAGCHRPVKFLSQVRRYLTPIRRIRSSERLTVDLSGPPVRAVLFCLESFPRTAELRFIRPCLDSFCLRYRALLRGFLPRPAPAGPLLRFAPFGLRSPEEFQSARKICSLKFFGPTA
jgi:hypothetical protein